MGHSIRRNAGIDGFVIPGIRRPLKAIMFADDNNGITCSAEGVVNTLKEYNYYCKASGVSLNLSKLMGMAIGTTV